MATLSTTTLKISAADLNLDPEDLEAELEEQEFRSAYNQFSWKKKHVAKVNTNHNKKHTYETHIQNW